MSNEMIVPDANTVIVPQQNNDRDSFAMLERRNRFFEQVMMVAIKATSANDWVDQNGKPYLGSSGCEKVACRFAVRVFGLKTEREDLEDEKGRYYLYTTTGKAALGDGHENEVIGTCSSRDKFFAMKEGKLKPIQDVDIANIKKKSVTNFYGNAIRKLLGLNNLTWDDLAKFGITKAGKTSVQYNSKKKDSHTTTSKPAVETETNDSGKKPFWRSEYNGKDYLWVQAGKHFGAQWLQDLGMKESSTAGKFFTTYTEELWKKFEKDFAESEEMLG